MNGKKGSIEIKIPDSIAKGKQPEKKSEIIFSWQGWFVSVWEFCKQDPKRVIFSLKVGLAVLLVSLLILLPEPYQVFGPNIIWSILTVAIMFEYTVGSTFNRGFNRAVGSLLAGALAIVIAQVALSTGHIGEPIIIGISLFLVGIVTSFMKIWPALVQYEYGFRVMLFTYCLIIVSGYQVGNPIKMSMDRLYSIAIGAIIAVLVNVLVCPIWAGDQLHRELVSNFNSVADSLEECVGKYLEVDGLDHPEFTKTVADDFPDEPAYKKCHATLNSSAKLESLANSAKWEPPHGRFCHFFYPWSEYVKVGAVLRYCAYEVMALHGVLHSEIQAPYNLRITFQKEIQEATSQAAELVRCLGKDISSMKQSLKVSILANLHCSTERLQRAITMHSYLFTPNFEIPKASSKQIPNSSYNNPDDEFSQQLADLNSTKPTDHNSQQSETHTEPYPYHDEKLSHSMEIDAALEEKEGYGVDYCIPKMKAFERSAALSLPTFTSLLVEFVARLEHLVEAVDQLSKLAKFAPPQPAAQ